MSLFDQEGRRNNMKKLRKRKIKRRVREGKKRLPATIDLGDLNNLFIKFCIKVLKDGDIEKVDRVIGFIKDIRSIQNQKENMTYEKAFFLEQLDRHGLDAKDYLLAKEI